MFRKRMRESILVFAVSAITLLGLIGCSSPSRPEPQVQDSGADVPDPAAATGGYDAYAAIVNAIPERLSVEGFQLINHLPDNAVYHGFDPEMAWNKRDMTVVDGDAGKPTQAEFIYLHEESGIVVVVQPMYVPTYLEPDIVGFVSIPAEQPKLPGWIDLTPPNMHTEIFSFGHAVVVLTAFPRFPDVDVTALEVVLAKKELGLGLKQMLDESFPPM